MSKVFFSVIFILISSSVVLAGEMSHAVSKFNDIEVSIDFNTLINSSSGSSWVDTTLDKETWINVSGKKLHGTEQLSLIFTNESGGEFKIIDLTYRDGLEGGGNRYTAKLGIEYTTIYRQRDVTSEKRKYRQQFVLKQGTFLHPVQTLYLIDSVGNRY